ncbi:sinapyl alcohol dehydrogenase activity [Hyphomicrobium sp. 1Nfss2.1]
MRIGGDVFGIAAIECVSGEFRLVAQVLSTRPAEVAAPAGEAEPGHANALADLESARFRTHRNYAANDLVPGNDAGFWMLQLAVDDVQIGAADAARSDTDEKIATGRLPYGTLGWMKWLMRARKLHRMHALGDRIHRDVRHLLMTAKLEQLRKRDVKERVTLWAYASS